jgi:hypothetical protein
VSRYRALSRLLVAGIVVCSFAASAPARASPRADEHRWPLDASKLELVRCRAQAVEYRGRQALRLMPVAGQERTDTTMVAILAGSDFRAGTIALDVAGSPRVDIAPGSRGFIGLALHVTGEPERYECFYVRPTNARCDDQVRRNHTVQYVSVPDYPWQRLRQEAPGMYESYTDMEAGAWTHLELRVEGTHAQLFINGASQPALIVNDLKLGDPRGAVALWSWTYTDGYFADLTVTPHD